jgi:putative DNA primase/helicase
MTSEAFGQDVEASPLTEAGAAERFAWQYGDDLRFDHRRQRWLLWSGHRWTPDADAEVTRVALEFARSWQREALEIVDTKHKADTLKLAVSLERRDRLLSLLAFARDLRPIADAGDGWDSDPWLFGVPNGVVDLRTGTLRPGRREDRITMSTATRYEPDAACPRWERFIAEVFRDSDLADFIHRALGYSLSGDTSEQCLLFCHGGGSNGKGTLLNTVQRHVLGEYGHALAFSAIEHDPRPGAASNELAALLGRRFVVSSEASEGRRLDEGRIKWITGGDPIRARFLYAESFEFVPTAKFWLAANHKPVVRDDSYGFWRRIRLVPFTQSFRIDPTLAGALAAEAAGILAWLVRGCLAWQREGLAPPPIVAEATRAYQQDSDPLSQFIDDAIDADEHSQIPARDLFAHYREWASEQGLSDRERLTATAFGRKAAERFPRVKTRHGHAYQGIARRPS